MAQAFRSASLRVAFGAACAMALAGPATAEDVVQEVDGVVADAADAAQVAPDVRAQRRQPDRIEEIVVFARKREERLQDTPISITAFNQDGLKDLNITRINDIGDLVPNLQFDQAVGQANAARISIRGVGNGDPASFDDPGVGLYVDGVYLPRAQGALLAVSDIARVEVLRGPQGTLFGKNTIGGAVNIITQKPSFDGFTGEGEVRLGNYDLLETKLVLNVPIVPERVATRWSFSTQQRDGYTKNRFLGGDSTVGRRRQLAVRGQFLFNPTDTFEVLLSGDHSNEPNTPVPGHCKFLGPNPDADNPVGDTGAAALAVAAQLAAFPEFAAARAANPAAVAPFEQECRDIDAGDNFKTRVDGRQEDELKTFGTNLTMTWSPTEAVTIKSISSWRRNETFALGDADLTSIPIAQDGRDDNDRGTQDAYSQEFNISGLAMDGRLKWTGGAYAFAEQNRDDDRAQTIPLTGLVTARLPALGPIVLPDGTMISRVVSAADLAAGMFAFGEPGAIRRNSTVNGIRCEVLPAAPDAAGNAQVNLCGFRTFIGASTQSFLKSSSSSLAAYTQGTFDVTEKLSITGGVRYTTERKRIARFVRVTDDVAGDPFRFTPNTVMNGGVTTNFETSERFGKWTPMLNLQYRFNDEVNVYATYSRGFKSGLLNGRAGEIEGGTVKVEPEVLTSYEVGLKSRFFDDRLTMNVAVFTNTYDDIQLTVIGQNAQGNLAAIIDNAGEAIINGAEFEFRGVVVPGLILDGSLGVSAARYAEFERAGFQNNKLPNTPAYTGSIGATYTIPLGTLGDLRTRVGWTHTGEKASDVSDPHVNRSPKHGLLSGRIALEMADGQTTLAIFGSNLLNREYVANAIRGTSTTLQYFGPPRTFGLEVSRRF
jgi:iron complex outermembrane receptor protein